MKNIWDRIVEALELACLAISQFPAVTLALIVGLIVLATCT